MKKKRKNPFFKGMVGVFEDNELGVLILGAGSGLNPSICIGRGGRGIYTLLEMECL